MPGHRRISYDQLKRFCRPAAAAAALAVLALAGANPAAARGRPEENFTLRAAVSLPNGQKIQSFDISFVDQFDGIYLLADRTNKDVESVDVLNNRIAALYTANFAGIVGSNFNAAGPNGILTVTDPSTGISYLWAGDFGNGSNGPVGGLVKVINLDDGSLVKTISTGGTARADELCYDPKDHVIMIANDAEPLPPTGNGPYLTFIDSQTYAVQGQLLLGGQNDNIKATNGIEQCQYVGKTGHFYVNIPEVNGPGDDSAAGAVLEIDPVARTIVNVFTIPHGKCEGPQGMAVGPYPQLLLGCNDPLKDVPSTVTINLTDGKVLNTFAGEDGSDEVDYDPSDGHYFLAESGGANPQHLGIIDALTAKGLKIGVEDPSKTIGLAGAAGNHSVAADPFTNKVFVPIAATSGAGICSSVGGDDSVGCIAVYKATNGKNEGE